MDNSLIAIENVLKLLSGKMGSFYLAGGTPLSIYYFHHRESYDLDFFTKAFSRAEIEGIISRLRDSLKIEPELAEEQNKKDNARYLIYLLQLDRKNSLKIDFVEDLFELVKPLKVVDGIPALSIEDIYIRKIYAACGVVERVDSAGKKLFKGGRSEAKDFFDLYFLSTTFMPLSEFSTIYCGQTQLESIVVWFRTYDRFAIKSGLPEIITNKRIDFYEMERHFKNEVEQLIRKIY